MKVLLQRVNSASVKIGKDTVARIGKGLLLFVGIEQNDDQKDIRYMRDKTLNLRVFESEIGKMDRSVIDEKGEILLVSQFTLCADCMKGRRPDFGNAAPPEKAEKLFEETLEMFKQSGLEVQSGRFRTYMQIELVNDGPVTIMLQSPNKS